MAKRRLIAFDWALKRLLCSKANFEILEGFLSELLRDDITILEILESESNQETRQHKFNRVDLKVENNKGEIVIVEVQYAREFDYLHRILLGVCKAITEHLHKGEAYAQVVKVISVSILYFDLGQGKDYVYHGTTNFCGLHHHDELQLSHKQKERFQRTKVADIYPEYYLLKVNQFDDVAKDSLDEWIYFLKNEEIKDEFQARGLQQAKEALDVLRLPKDQRQAYEVYLEDLRYQASMYLSSYGDGKYDGRKEGVQEGRQQGRQEGLQQGLQQGRQEGIIQVAVTLLALHADEQIASITGLPLAKVQQLRAQTAD